MNELQMNYKWRLYSIIQGGGYIDSGEISDVVITGNVTEDGKLEY